MRVVTGVITASCLLPRASPRRTHSFATNLQQSICAFSANSEFSRLAACCVASASKCRHNAREGDASHRTAPLARERLRCPTIILLRRAISRTEQCDAPPGYSVRSASNPIRSRQARDAASAVICGVGVERPCGLLPRANAPTPAGSPPPSSPEPISMMAKRASLSCYLLIRFADDTSTANRPNIKPHAKLLGRMPWRAWY